jgi:multidrug efflux pump subunit AcrA (membrane-fusion protein)
VEGAVTVPGTALLGTGSDAAVVVIEEGRLARRKVTVGPRDEQAGVVAIESGLQAGEKVLARPAPNVAVGRAVVVAEEQPAAAPDTTTER